MTKRIKYPLEDGIGFVELEKYMGDELDIVNNARVSYDRSSQVWTDNDAALLDNLLKWEHGTPFEAVVFRFKIKMPIFVAREIMRERICSWNEESSRFHKKANEYYAPDDMTLEDSRNAYRVYERRLAYYRGIGNNLKRSRELAALLLPLNVYTTVIWTVNARNLLHFMRIRNADDVRPETREYAKAIEEMFAMVLPLAYQAFLDHERIAP
jgi:thymidylate synthase (FAD)